MHMSEHHRSGDANTYSDCFDNWTRLPTSVRDRLQSCACYISKYNKGYKKKAFSQELLEVRLLACS